MSTLSFLSNDSSWEDNDLVRPPTARIVPYEMRERDIVKKQHKREPSDDTTHRIEQYMGQSNFVDLQLQGILQKHAIEVGRSTSTYSTAHSQSYSVPPTPSSHGEVGLATGIGSPTIPFKNSLASRVTVETIGSSSMAALNVKGDTIGSGLSNTKRLFVDTTAEAISGSFTSKSPQTQIVLSEDETTSPKEAIPSPQKRVAPLAYVYRAPEVVSPPRLVSPSGTPKVSCSPKVKITVELQSTDGKAPPSATLAKDKSSDNTDNDKDTSSNSGSDTTFEKDPAEEIAEATPSSPVPKSHLSAEVAQGELEQSIVGLKSTALESEVAVESPKAAQELTDTQDKGKKPAESISGTTIELESYGAFCYARFRELIFCLPTQRGSWDNADVSGSKTDTETIQSGIEEAVSAESVELDGVLGEYGSSESAEGPSLPSVDLQNPIFHDDDKRIGMDSAGVIDGNGKKDSKPILRTPKFCKRLFTPKMRKEREGEFIDSGVLDTTYAGGQATVHGVEKKKILGIFGKRRKQNRKVTFSRNERDYFTKITQHSTKKDRLWHAHSNPVIQRFTRRSE